MAKKVKVRRGNVALGEFSMKELVESLDNGKVSCYDKVYYAKKDEWIEISKIKDIDEYASKDYHWKYEKDGEIRGPITKDDLIFFIKDGKILATDKVYHPYLKEWKKVDEVDEFKQFVKEEKREKEHGIGLDEALKVVEYKMCPKCGMQNLKSADSCVGCGYEFVEEKQE